MYKKNHIQFYIPLHKISNLSESVQYIKTLIKDNETRSITSNIKKEKSEYFRIRGTLQNAKTKTKFARSSFLNIQNKKLRVA